MGREKENRTDAKKKHAAKVKERYYSEDGKQYIASHKVMPTVRYARGRYNANRRGKEFKLTLSEYTVLVAAPCTYCNMSIANETGVGLDRIENSKGYITGNVNPCCAACNRIRSKSMGADEFKRQTILNKRRVD